MIFSSTTQSSTWRRWVYDRIVGIARATTATLGITSTHATDSAIQLIDGNGNSVGWLYGQATGISLLDKGGNSSFLCNNDSDFIWSSDGAVESMRLARTSPGDFTLSITGGLTVSGSVVIMENLPTSDPSVAGQLWNNSSVLNVSSG